ncbi:MAG: hypothetical protein JWR38_4418 [Mucilaginibacter sp.]|nr:hypothetical protein [Mucilaginibacter sp.]
MCHIHLIISVFDLVINFIALSVSICFNYPDIIFMLIYGILCIPASSRKQAIS